MTSDLKVIGRSEFKTMSILGILAPKNIIYSYKLNVTLVTFDLDLKVKKRSKFKMTTTIEFRG